jgi:hypothetical protein
MEITVVDSEDWTGLYINGTLEYEGHSIPWFEVVEALQRRGANLVVKDRYAMVSEEWIQGRGKLPRKLDEVIFE